MIAKTSIQSLAHTFDFDKLNSKRSEIAYYQLMRKEPLFARDPEQVLFYLRMITKDWDQKHKNAVDQLLPTVESLKKKLIATAIKAVSLYAQQKAQEKALGKGEPDLSAKELHRQAWAIVEPVFQQEREEAADRFRQLADTSSASDNLVDIIPSACQGRVEVLFVTLGSQQWGRFDPATNQIQLRQAAEPGDEDLIDLAAVQTFLNGGSVYAVEADQMPTGAVMAALFRY